tara:strand:+ start:5546 stop:6031 length:486 start_codon:yes stop_codon:yes gene_type:complete
MISLYLILHFIFGALLILSSLYINYICYQIKKNYNLKNQNKIKIISEFSDKTEMLFIFFLPMLAILYLTTNQELLNHLNLYFKFILYIILIIIFLKSRIILKNMITGEIVLKKNLIKIRKFYLYRQLYLFVLFITFFYTPVNNGLIKTLKLFKILFRSQFS